MPRRGGDAPPPSLSKAVSAATPCAALAVQELHVGVSAGTSSVLFGWCLVEARRACSSVSPPLCAAKGTPRRSPGSERWLRCGPFLRASRTGRGGTGSPRDAGTAGGSSDRSASFPDPGEVLRTPDPGSFTDAAKRTPSGARRAAQLRPASRKLCICSDHRPDEGLIDTDQGLALDRTGQSAQGRGT